MTSQPSSTFKSADPLDVRKPFAADKARFARVYGSGVRCPTLRFPESDPKNLQLLPEPSKRTAKDPDADKENRPSKKEKENEKSKSADTTIAATVFPKHKGNGKRAPLKDTTNEKSGGMPSAKRIRLGDKWMEDKLEESKGSVVTWP
jgi:hypothetical protein